MTSTSRAHTRSTNLAAWLIAKGIPLDHAEAGPSGDCVFVFAIPQECLIVQEGAYLSGGQCSGISILNAQRQLKALIRKILLKDSPR